MNPPNILFLMSDEHRADCTGFAGNSVVRTPVLDQLAETGVVFDNAYTPSPICIPGRQCLMSGQLPSTNGCYTFGDDLPPNHMTFARRFAQHAYHAVCSGKLHHTGPDQMQGWTSRIAPDCVVSPPHIEGRNEEAFKRYAPEPGTGKWTNQKEIERAGVSDGPYRRFDRNATRAANEFIEDYFCHPYYDRPQNHLPLFLKLSLIQPHYPFFTDAERFTYYLNRIPIFDEDRFDHPVLSRTQCGPDVEAAPRDLRRATAAYYGMVDQLDCHYGEVLERLEHVGQDLDDWIIVYTSDHGEMLGQHGIWEKTRFFEGSVRVPLIIRWPKRFAGGSRIRQNVSLCDLFATLCDLADLPTPEGLDSRSLVPLLEGKAPDWNDEVVSQIGNHTLIKRGPLKYQYYADHGPEVLFDLDADPGETRNVLDASEHADAVREFRKRLTELQTKARSLKP